MPLLSLAALRDREEGPVPLVPLVALPLSLCSAPPFPCLLCHRERSRAALSLSGRVTRCVSVSVSRESYMLVRMPFVAQQQLLLLLLRC